MTSELLRCGTLYVVITLVGVNVGNGCALPLLLTVGGGATAAGCSPRTLCDTDLLCPAAEVGLALCCDLLLECPITDCARDIPGRVVVLAAKPGCCRPRDGPCVDENEWELFGPACAVLLASPLTCRIDDGAAGFLLEYGCPARSAKVGRFDCDSKTDCVVVNVLFSALVAWLVANSRSEGLCLSVGTAGGGIADLTLFSDAVISVKPSDGIVTFCGMRRREPDIACRERSLLDNTLCASAR
jgi:hypothetical protein